MKRSGLIIGGAAANLPPLGSNGHGNDAAPAGDPQAEAGLTVPPRAHTNAGTETAELLAARQTYASLQATSEDAVVMLPVDIIDRGRFQNRIVFDRTYIEGLAENIRTDGLTSPIVVRPKDGGRYELIAGENRLEAHKLIGAKEIKANIQIIDDNKAVRLTVLDNIFHRTMTDYEIYCGLKMLLDEGAVVSKRALTNETGYSSTQIHRIMSFEKFPSEAIEILNARPGLLGATAAEKLSQLIAAGFDVAVVEALRMIEQGKLTETRAESWVKNQSSPAKQRSDRQIIFSSGKPFAKLIRESTTISIKCAAGVDAEGVEAAIYALLADKAGDGAKNE